MPADRERSGLRVRFEDLQDPNLFRLNSIIDLIASQLQRTQGQVAAGGVPVSLSGLHHDRATKYDAAAYQVGSTFFETDRTVVYQVRYDARGQAAWFYSFGAYRNTISPDERPTDLGVNDTGFQFQDSATGQNYTWDGTGWVTSVTATPLIVDTHANRAGYLATDYSIGTEYWETDRTARYAVEDVGGTNTWVWIDGQMVGTITPDQRPADLGTDDEGFLFRATDDEQFTYRWDGAAWEVVEISTSRVRVHGTSADGHWLEFTSATATTKSRIYRDDDNDRISISVNAYHDGANWQRDDEAAHARAIMITPAGALMFRYAPAGANPITWDTPDPLRIDLNGYVRAKIHRGVLADLPGGLGAEDENYLFYVTDYHHTLRWNGAAWEWAPGDDKSGYFRDSAVDPGTGWKECDGTGDDGVAIGAAHPITILNGDGTTTDITALDNQADTYLKGGAAFTGSNAAAVAPGISGETADENTHTHNVTIASENTGIPSAVSVVQAGLGISVASFDHVHNNNTDQTVASAAGSAHKHGVGTLAVDATGTPKSLVVRRFIRK